MTRDKLVPYIVLGIIILGVLFLLSKRAEAASETVSWNAVTTKANGQPLTDLASYTLEWGVCSAGTFGTPLGSKSVLAPATTTIVDNLAPGNTAFRVRAVRAVSATVNAPPGAFSAVVCKVVPIDSTPPGVPVITTITSVAYELRNNWLLGPRMVAVGVVGLGEVCGKPWVRDTSYARLTASQVALGRKYRGGKLFGSCA
jgi:hypothetical protein